MKFINASFIIFTSLVITSDIFADAEQQLRGHLVLVSFVNNTITGDAGRTLMSAAENAVVATDKVDIRDWDEWECEIECDMECDMKCYMECRWGEKECEQECESECQHECKHKCNRDRGLVENEDVLISFVNDTITGDAGRTMMSAAESAVVATETLDNRGWQCESECAYECDMDCDWDCKYEWGCAGEKECEQECKWECYHECKHKCNRECN